MPDIKLPPGYQLDQQAAAAAPSSVRLPAGYTLDQPGSTPSVSSTISDDSGNVIAASGAPFRSSVPAGTPDDALIRHFGLDPEQIKKSPAYQSAVKKYGSGLSFYLSDPEASALRKAVMPVADSFVGDMGMGALDLVRGVHQLAVHGLNKAGVVSDADAQYNDLINRVIEEDYTQNIRHGKPNWFARLIGNAAVPLPGSAAIGEGSALLRAGKQALVGAEAAAVQPVNDAGDYWASKAKQVATGAVVAPAVGAVGNLLAKGGTKVLNAAQGNLPAEAAAVADAGERAGVRMTYGDITRSPRAQQVEVDMEKVPGLGMSGWRKAQHDEARAAAESAKGKLEARFRSMAPDAIEDVQKAAGEGDEYARRLLDQITNAGDDPDRVMQVAIGLQNFRTKADAEALYNTVGQLVEENKLGNVPVNLSGIREALDHALEDSQAAVIPNKKLISLLKDIDAGLGDGATYSRLRRFRSDLGDIIREHRQNDNAIIGEKGIGYLERLRGATEGDLQYFIDESGVPEIQKAAHEADQFYKRYRVPFKDAQLTSAAASTEPDQIFQKFMMAGKGDRAQKFYNALDEKARAAVRYEMVNRAIDQATNSAKDVFSPTQFFKYLDKLSDGYGVFFKGQEKWEMDGLKNVMSHIARAGQYAENPPTGNRLLGAAMSFGAPLAAGYGAATHPAATAAGFGIAGGVAGMSRFLLTTNAGKKLLLASTKLEPGSEAMQKLLDKITNEIAPDAAARAAAKN